MNLKETKLKGSNVMELQVFGDARGTIFDVAVNIWHEINAV